MLLVPFSSTNISIQLRLACLPETLIDGTVELHVRVFCADTAAAMVNFWEMIAVGSCHALVRRACLKCCSQQLETKAIVQPIQGPIEKRDLSNALQQLNVAILG